MTLLVKEVHVGQPEETTTVIHVVDSVEDAVAAICTHLQREISQTVSYLTEGIYQDLADRLATDFDAPLETVVGDMLRELNCPYINGMVQIYTYGEIMQKISNAKAEYDPVPYYTDGDVSSWAYYGDSADDFVVSFPFSEALVFVVEEAIWDETTWKAGRYADEEAV